MCDGNSVTLTMDEIASVADVLANAFDECRVFVGYQAQMGACTPPEIPTSPNTGGGTNFNSDDANIAVRAYPNPYEETLIFEVTVKNAGQSTLELYNMLGQKIATVYDGFLKANSKTTVKFDVPQAQQKNLVFFFRQNGKSVNGRLVRPN
jgi:hypothetical protein